MRSYRLIILALVAALPLWAQTQQPEQQQQPIDPTARLAVPATVSGNMLPMETVREGQRNREWGGGVEVGADCDDNALSRTEDQVGDCAYGIRPSIRFQQAGSRSSWNLIYAPDFIVHQKYSTLNEMGHRFGADAQYRFTRRLTVRVRESFERTTDFFNGLDTSTGLPTFGILQTPNQVVALPTARRIANTSSLEATYQLSATSVTGVSASYSDFQYENVAAGTTTLPRTQTGTAGAFYSRLVARRHWIGVNYNFQHLRWGGSEWAVTHSVAYTHTFLLGPHLMISGFVGPDYSRRHGQETLFLFPFGFYTFPTLSDTWSVTGGGTVGWESAHNQLQASFARRVGDGGGLTGPANLNNVMVSFRRRLTAKLSTSIIGSYGDTDSLATQTTSPTGISDFQTVLLQGGLDYQVQEHVTVRMYYGRDWQENTSSSITSRVHRNRVGLWVGYSFTRPLGR